ncbi:hypothetical protein L2164_21750, partial [Pectobacterium brasiliense]|nr:hypothetical protein [Pectobacterium brasiliense]
KKSFNRNFILFKPPLKHFKNINWVLYQIVKLDPETFTIHSTNQTMQNPTEISSFHQPHHANSIEEHSRACNLCGRYLLQFSTFSGDSKAQLA